MTTIATPKRTSSASFSASREPVDHDRGAGDDVAAAVQLEAGRGLALLGAGLARRRVVDRGLDQLERAASRSASLRSGLQPHDDLGRVAVGEEVGEPRLRRAAGAAEVEDDGGDEFRVVEAGHAGDPVAGGDREQEFAEPLRRHPPDSRRSWRSIWITASLRKVAGPETNSTGSSSASSVQGPGIGFAPSGTFPERQPSSRSSRKMFAVRISSCRSPSRQHHDRFFTEGLPHLLRRPVGRGIGVDQRVRPGVGRDPRRPDPGGDREDQAHREHHPRVAGGPRRDAAEPLPGVQLSPSRAGR